METHQKHSNRGLLLVLVCLYIAAIAWFSWANWSADPKGNPLWTMVVNALLISVPLVLLFGSIYVLVSAYRQRAQTGRVGPRLSAAIRRSPRLAAILMIAFTSLFSLDVFGTGAPLLEQIGGFLIHNIPSLVMLLVLVFAWKRPLAGFFAFLAVALLFTIFFVRDLDSLPSLFLFAFPLLMVALLFYADWKWLGPQQPEEI